MFPWYYLHLSILWLPILIQSYDFCLKNLILYISLLYMYYLLYIILYACDMLSASYLMLIVYLHNFYLSFEVIHFKFVSLFFSFCSPSILFIFLSFFLLISSIFSAFLFLFLSILVSFLCSFFFLLSFFLWRDWGLS